MGKFSLRIARFTFRAKVGVDGGQTWAGNSIVETHFGCITLFFFLFVTEPSTQRFFRAACRSPTKVSNGFGTTLEDNYEPINLLKKLGRRIGGRYTGVRPKDSLLPPKWRLR